MFGVSPFSGTSTTWRPAETQSAINATRSSLFRKIRHCTVGTTAGPILLVLVRKSSKPLLLTLFSSGGGTRTHNLRINSPPLCQLSYPGTTHGVYQRASAPFRRARFR